MSTSSPPTWNEYRLALRDLLDAISNEEGNKGEYILTDWRCPECTANTTPYSVSRTCARHRAAALIRAGGDILLPDLLANEAHG